MKWIFVFAKSKLQCWCKNSIFISFKKHDKNHFEMELVFTPVECGGVALCDSSTIHVHKLYLYSYFNGEWVNNDPSLNQSMQVLLSKKFKHLYIFIHFKLNSVKMFFKKLFAG